MGDADQLGLTRAGAAVKPAQRPVAGARLRVLDEHSRVEPVGGGHLGVERAGEEPAVVAMR